MEGVSRRRPAVNLVLDTSVTLAWIYPDETTDAVRQVFDAIASHGAVVPALWPLEVANSLTIGMRRGRITAPFRAAALADLARLEISVDPETDARAWDATLRLADQFQLTVYDAAYLELAQRRLLPLASLDNELREAAQAAGVELLGTSG
jgi:predicted nucleic acid-binding protein